MSTHHRIPSGRRGFLKNVATAGTAALAGATVSPAAAAIPSPDRRLRIGIVGAGDYSFTSYCWSDIIEPDKAPNNEKRGTFGTQLLNMDITHVWDTKPEATQKFAERMGATTVSKYDGMVGKVDGVIFGGLYEVPWQHRLARPYVEAGIPVYLSRPFAFCLRDIDEILECAAKNNTPILATAKFEHYNEAPALKDKLKSLGEIQLENIRKKTEIFLTAYYSHLERGGTPVKVGTVPVDWKAPSPMPGWIDESMFKD